MHIFRFLITEGSVRAQDARARGSVSLLFVNNFAGLEAQERAARGRSAQYAMRSTQCAVRNAQYAMRSTQCAVRNAQYAMRSTQCAKRSAQ